jgi:hypothetical protein
MAAAAAAARGSAWRANVTADHQPTHVAPGGHGAGEARHEARQILPRFSAQQQNGQGGGGGYLFEGWS